jgi:putative transcriptional regulator
VGKSRENLDHCVTCTTLLLTLFLLLRSSLPVVLMLSVGNGKSTGVVINRPLDGTLKDAAKGSNVAKPIQSTFASSTVSYGGPVKEEDLAILHSNPFAEGSREIVPGVFVGGSEGLRKLVCHQEFHPTKALFARGRAEWIPGQLDREIDRGVWRVASASPSLILRHASAKSSTDVAAHGTESGLWNDVLQCMGGKYSNISDNFRE